MIMAATATVTPSTGCRNGVTSASRSPAVESVVDAQANRILRNNSPSEACIDPSLGPYVTSLLRCCRDLERWEEVSGRIDVDSLMELLQEQCCMSKERSWVSLRDIFSCVRNGVVEPIGGGNAIKSDKEDGLMLLGKMLSETEIRTQPCLVKGGVQYQARITAELDFCFEEDDVLERDPTKQDLHEVQTSRRNEVLSATPLKPTTLIPADLLGVLDNPPTPANTTHDVTLHENTTNNSDTSNPSPSPSPPISKKDLAHDLATSLFKQPRSRSNSIITEKKSSPMLRPTAPNNNNITYEPTVEMLLSINPELSEDAAWEAALVSRNDVNVAQYVLEKAMSAPPVCRHMLNNSCYRSDCQFSHDIKGHTCLFWLKGRCGKENCRFLHGFPEHLLEGMNKEYLPPQAIPIPVTTTNLVQHNMSTSPQPFSFLSSSLDSMGSAFGSGGAYSLPIAHQQSSPVLTSSLGNASSNTLLQHRFGLDNSNDISQDNNNGDYPAIQETTARYKYTPPSKKTIQKRSTSFASIASKGYNKSSFIGPKGETKEENNAIKYVNIPEDLRIFHRNMSSFFHIADPLQRYYEVAKSNHLDYSVIDLHFQSLKTFPTVLAAVLPDKVMPVWVVTGSGNHLPKNKHGVLENAVVRWLTEKGYEVLKGREKNGYSGALLVKGKKR